MSRLSPLTLLASIAIAAPIAAFSVPAAAQGSKVSEIIVYGTDPCPRSTDDEVVVCARKPEGERYRIPERYGRTGINSCSAVGPGGFTGCTQQLINQAFRERGEQAAEETIPDE